jgi:hypothetical protein
MKSERGRKMQEREALRTQYGALFETVTAILFEADPQGINYKTNTDEYDPETGTILPRLSQAGTSHDVAVIVHEEFARWFGAEEVGAVDEYQLIATRIWQAWCTFAPKPLSQKVAMWQIELIDEPSYLFGSSDNPRQYAFELDLSGEYLPSSIHGVIIDGVPTAVVGASGGATGINSNSLLEAGGCVYLAVGPFVVCFDTTPFQYRWALEIDPATCFGVYYCERTDALLSHGEMEVARFSNAGQLIWSQSGADIFTEGFTLRTNFIEAIDFNGKVYQFDFADGNKPVG